MSTAKETADAPHSAIEQRVAEQEYPHRDPDILRELYIDAEKTQKETAEMLGCGVSTICKYLQRHNIDTRVPAGPSEAALEACRIDHAGYGVSETGYEYWSVRDPDKVRTVTVHQLLACLDNNPHDVFAADTEVHHRTQHPAANVPSLLSVLTQREHRRVHRNGEWTVTEDGSYPVLVED